MKSKKKIIIKIASSWKSDDSSKAPIVCEPIKVSPLKKKSFWCYVYEKSGRKGKCVSDSGRSTSLVRTIINVLKKTWMNQINRINSWGFTRPYLPVSNESSRIQFDFPGRNQAPPPPSCPVVVPKRIQSSNYDFVGSWSFDSTPVTFCLSRENQCGNWDELFEDANWRGGETRHEPLSQGCWMFMCVEIKMARRWKNK